MIKHAEFYDHRLISLSSVESASTTYIWRMFESTKSGNVKIVQQLVENCPGLATYEYNYTPVIHFAVRLQRS